LAPRDCRAEETIVSEQPTPDQIMQTGIGFIASKTAVADKD